MPGPSDQLNKLYAHAEQLRRSGDHRALAAVSEQILALDPDSTGALQFLALWHSGNQRHDAALPYLERYCHAQPRDDKFRMALAVALDECGKAEQALPHLRQLVARQPESLMALLYYAAALDKCGQPDAAAIVAFQAHQLNPAVRAMPEDQAADPALRERAGFSNQALHEAGQKIRREACRETLIRYPDADVERLRSIEFPFLAKNEPAYRDAGQRAAMLYFSALEPRSWFEREEFDWVEYVESEFPAIRDEILAKLDVATDARPYLRSGRGEFQESVNSLVNSMDWASSWFYDDHGRNAKIFTKFAHTGSVIEQLPLFTVGGHPWDTLVSILAPGQHIKPHYGRTNAVLTVHLPLYVPGEPGDCFVRAGAEARPQHAGECLIFDDSFLHEAVNPTAETRIVLIFEVWHPGLTEAEQFAVQQAILAYRKLSSGMGRLLKAGAGG